MYDVETSDYVLVRSGIDNHILNSFHATIGGFRKLFVKCDSNHELSRSIRLLSPLSTVIDVMSVPYNSPIDIIIDLIGPDIVFTRAIADGVSDEIAMSIIIKELMQIPKDLRFLANAPPIYIHSMQRGDNWIGDTYAADMICHAISYCNIDLSGIKFLDLGCSSGALLRILAACFPNTFFLGTDPVTSSIDWAQTSLGRFNLEFLIQSQVPPLGIEANSIDIVSAVSIFSHHGPSAARLWFEEIARVLRPQGILIFTAHGVGSILYYVEQNLKPVERFQEIYANFLSTGFVFEEVWLDVDDVGNGATASEWGNSFYDIKVIAQLLAPWFEIIYFGSRVNQNNQDLYIVKKCN